MATMISIDYLNLHKTKIDPENDILLQYCADTGDYYLITNSECDEYLKGCPTEQEALEQFLELVRYWESDEYLQDYPPEELEDD